MAGVELVMSISVKFAFFLHKGKQITDDKRKIFRFGTS